MSLSWIGLSTSDSSSLFFSSDDEEGIPTSGAPTSMQILGAVRRVISKSI